MATGIITISNETPPSIPTRARTHQERRGVGDDNRKKAMHTAKKHAFQEKYKGSLGQSAWTAGSTLALIPMAVCLGLVANASSLNTSVALAARIASWGLWVGAQLRSFMIFHDCCHGSFVQAPTPYARTLNNAAKYFFSAVCATPTDWGRGHNLHHKHSGNLGQELYDWNETIFHTTEQYRKMSRRTQLLYRFFRQPAVFFAFGGVLTWWVRFRLPFEVQKYFEFRSSDKMLNTVWIAARYVAAQRLGILVTVVAGDYATMVIGMLLFHWQHVYDAGYGVQNNEEWKMEYASFQGSSFLHVHPILKPWTLGIEYHHLHHVNVRIPSYMLKPCHDEAPDGLWDEVQVKHMTLTDMWASLFLTLWDTNTGSFVPFPP